MLRASFAVSLMARRSRLGASPVLRSAHSAGFARVLQKLARARISARASIAASNLGHLRAGSALSQTSRITRHAVRAARTTRPHARRRSRRDRTPGCGSRRAIAASPASPSGSPLSGTVNTGLSVTNDAPSRCRRAHAGQVVTRGADQRALAESRARGRDAGPCSGSCTPSAPDLVARARGRR